MASANYVAERETLTHLLFENPYDPGLYLERARCYEHLGFPDLATGDAYRALLLTDEAQDESGEYHELVLEALSKARNNRGERGRMNGACNRNGHMTNCDGLASGLDGNSEGGSEDEEDNDAAHELAVTYALESYQKLARNLTRCGCLRAAFDFCQRGSTAFPKDQSLRDMRQAVLATNRATKLQRDPSWDESSFDPKTDLPDQGSVRRELYPWNTHEPDRFSATSLAVLNASLRKVAPKCAVRSVSLPLLTSSASSSSQGSVRQLGLFATADFAPGETVLNEASILTANNRHLHPLCDACSSELPPISASSPDRHACPDCHDTVFCSASCAALAQSLYHPAICGKDVDAIGKDPDPQDAANALHLLLLGRTMALAETQRTHPLELPETKYIWADFAPPDPAYRHSDSASSVGHLPFSFGVNILAPLHLLEKMDVDIFAAEALHRYDTWVLNTLLAKFRGTASARLSTEDGRPEVCAVHPMWSLANHSCDPNVRWEWGGRTQFLARGAGGRVEWGGRRKEGGIRKGEEILNHYCDVELPVGERREWALGALGGMCACERCGWEERDGAEGQMEALRIST